MFNFLKSKLSKGLILYLIFGVLTTIINLATFYFCIKLFNINELISNVIAWIIGVVFAFITNKYIVFESKEKKLFIKELFTFTSSRLITLLMEELILLIFITLLNFNAFIIKSIAQILVIVFNYILSKFFVFKKSI